MFTPELMIILLNLVIVFVAYVSIYPKLAGDDMVKISMYDVLLSLFALLVVGMKFWGQGYEFNVLMGQVNWFWFTLISYFVLEVPFAIWYIKRTGIKL
jgi:hypothetical protein